MESLKSNDDALNAAAKPGSAGRRLRWALRAAGASGFLALSVALVLVAGRGSRLQAERDRMDAFARAAVAALDRVLDRLDQPRDAKIPQIEGLRKEILREVEACYEGFAKKEEPDRLDRFLTAICQAKLGRVRELAGRDTEALDAFRQAIQLFHGLCLDDPVNPHYRLQMARTYSAVGAFHERAGRHDNAASVCVQAVQVFGIVAPELREGPHEPYLRMGIALQEKGDQEYADEAFRHAAFAAQFSIAREPHNLAYMHALGESLYRLGMLRTQTGGVASAEESLRSALKVQEKLAAEVDSTTEHRTALVRSYLGLASVVGRGGKLQEAIDLAERAASLAEKLASEFPYSLALSKELAGASKLLAGVLQAAGKLQEAEAAQKKAVFALEGAMEQAGAGPEQRLELAKGLLGLGVFLASTGRPAEAMEPLARSKNLLDALAAEFPGQPQYGEAKAVCLHHLAIVLGRQGEKAQAIEAFQEALAMQEKLVSDHPEKPGYKNQVGETLSNLALQFLGDGKLGEALSLVEKAIAQQRAAVSASPKNLRYLEDLRNHHSILTEILLRQGDHASAAKRAEELPGYFPQRAEDAFAAACYLARAASLAEGDINLPESERKAVAQARADRALEMLKSSVGAGFRDSERLKGEAALEVLRDREDFKSLLEALGAAK